MFSILQVIGVLLCGALLWSGCSKRRTLMKGKECALRRRTARNAMSRTHRLPGFSRSD